MTLADKAKEAIGRLRPGSGGSGLVSRAETSGEKVATAAAAQRAKAAGDEDDAMFEGNYPVGVAANANPSTEGPARPRASALSEKTLDLETGDMAHYEPDDPVVLRKLFGIVIDEF